MADIAYPSGSKFDVTHSIDGILGTQNKKAKDTMNKLLTKLGNDLVEAGHNIDSPDTFVYIVTKCRNEMNEIYEKKWSVKI